MLNIVLPIAGRGSRFVKAGYNLPKPLIPIHGTPMIEVIIRNIRPRQPHRFIFLALAEHLESTPLASILKTADPGCTVVPVMGVTEGAACTVLLARDLINTAEPLMLANSDQYVDIDINEYLDQIACDRADGSMLTFYSDHPKWSYARLDANNYVTEVVEKQVVSQEATVGIYNFRRGCDFVRGAEQMIRRNLRVNNEFYVAPAYNELIAAGAKITVYNIGDKMFGIGTPEDLEAFLAHPVSRKCAKERLPGEALPFPSAAERCQQNPL